MNVGRAVAAAFAVALIALGIWLSGALATPPAAGKWTMLAVAAHTLPALAIIVAYRVLWLRVAAIWIGVFLFLQVPLSLLVIDQNYKTLLPRLTRTVEIAPGAVPGVSSPQTVTTDARGFRVTKTIDYASDSTKRIFAIGGSTTEQILLGDRKTWTHLLQEQLDAALGGNVEVINTGVSGLRAVHHVATLKAVERLHPDLIVVMVGVNDWNRQIREAFNPDAYATHLEFTDTLLGRTIGAVWGAIAPPDYTRDDVVIDSAYFGRRGNSLAKPDRRDFSATAVLADYPSALQSLFARCTTGPYKCLILTQPHAYADDVAPDLKSHFWMTPPDESWTVSFEAMRDVANLYNRATVAEACAAGVPVFDVAKDLPPTFATFYDDVHFNEPGARQIADRLTPPVVAVLKGHSETSICGSVAQ